MSILLMLHALVRWLIMITAVVAVVKLALGWLQGGSFQKFDRILTSAFSGLMDLQVTLGVIYLIWNGLAVEGFPMFRIAHGLIMIVAAFVAHLPARWKNAGDKERFRNTLLCVLGSLVLVFFGLMFLPVE